VDKNAKLRPFVREPSQSFEDLASYKEQHFETAKKVFENCDICITSTGQRHLGSALGSDSFLRDFMVTKITSWVDELENLSEVAKTEPQAAYAALTHGLIYSKVVVPHENHPRHLRPHGPT